MSQAARILIPREGLLQAAHEFHVASVGNFLLPRSIDEFDKLAATDRLWVAIIGSDIVAACYVTREDDEPEAEFGGIIVHKDHEGKTGLATAIGTVAISAHFLHDAFPLVAHVHLENTRPLDLLTKRLGFTKRDGPPAELKKSEIEKRLGHPISMKADADGFIRGHTFEFSRDKLAEFADRLESGKLARMKVEIDNLYFKASALSESVGILRGLATEAR